MAVKIASTQSSRKVKITPAIAEQMLNDHNTHNRPLSNRRVNFYSDQMIRGQWRYNPADTIVFDVNNVMLNGQHRLWAVIYSETTQEFLVVTGADPESQDVMDMGTKRTTAQQLALAGMISPTYIAAIARVYFKWTHGTLTKNGIPVSTLDIKDWANDADPAAIDFALHQGTRVNSLFPIRTGPAGAFAFAAFQIDKDEARQFFDDLCDGVGLTVGDPALTLSKYLQRRAMLGQRLPVVHQMWLLVSTWNTWRKGKSLNKIMSPSEWVAEEFPTMV